jgi:hypothetical protein
MRIGYGRIGICRHSMVVKRLRRSGKINRTSALGMFYDMAVGIFINKDFNNALIAFDRLMMKTCEIIRPDRANPGNHKKLQYGLKKNKSSAFRPK